MRNIGKQLHSTCVVVYSGEVRGGVGTRLHVLCRKGGVGTWVLLYFILG